MTNLRSERRCRWCARKIAISPALGRPRVYCKASCRQMAYAARKRAAELGLGEAELIVARTELEELRDRLYVLEAAVEDVERDLAESADEPAEVRRALEWLLEAARPLTEHRLQG